MAVAGVDVRDQIIAFKHKLALRPEALKRAYATAARDELFISPS